MAGTGDTGIPRLSSAELDRKLNFRGTGTGGNKGSPEELSSPNKGHVAHDPRRTPQNLHHTLAVEYMHVSQRQDPIGCHFGNGSKSTRWIDTTKEKKQHIFLPFSVSAFGFDAKFNTTKRFGLDGGGGVCRSVEGCD
jgi:hypothetical protein